MTGQISPKDAVWILSNTDPTMKVFYDARKVAEGPIPYTVENLLITGHLVRIVPAFYVTLTSRGEEHTLLSERLRSSLCASTP